MFSFVEKMNELGRAQVPFLFILDYELRSPIVLPLDQIDANEITFSIGNLSNEITKNYPPKSLEFDFQPPKQKDFKKAFDQIQEELHAGNTYLTNLCFKTPITCNWDLKTIFAQASAKYKLRYKEDFVFFSPETFVKIKNGKISTFPMKGTIDASIPNAKEVLLNDPKEEAEHATIVDLLRNDLSVIAKKVRLKKYKYLDLVQTNRGNIWQMSSEIQGVLADDYPAKIGDILKALLPAGSISGAPKKRTTEIIAATELSKRGYYTGIAGIFDGCELDSGVMIRFIEKDKKKLFYRSGGGVTAQSICKKEYQELQQKIYIPTINTNSLLVETIRLQNGVFENLEWHQKRMTKSRYEIFGLTEELPLAERLSRSQCDFGTQLMMCRVVYRKKIERIEFIPYKEKEVKSLQVVEISVAKNETKYKWANRSLYNKLLTQKGDANDILIIREGKVTDTSICNIALWDGLRWWTPTHPLLRGTTRARLLSLGVFSEKEISIGELFNYKKIRLFNAMIPWQSKKELLISSIKKNSPTDNR